MFNKWKFNLTVWELYIPRFSQSHFIYVKTIDGYILMYDITNKTSFNYITDYYNNIEKYLVKPKKMKKKIEKLVMKKEKIWQNN